MNSTLDIERLAKELGAERYEKVSAPGGYFGALQLAAEVASRSRVSESPLSSNELVKEIGKTARKEVQDQVREQRDAIARLEKQTGSAKAKAAEPAAKASKAPASDKRLDSPAK